MPDCFIATTIVDSNFPRREDYEEEIVSDVR